MAPKVPRAAGNSKKLRKWSKIRNIIKETYFYGVLGMPAHHPTLPGSHKWAHNAPKGSRTAGQCHRLTKGGVEVMMWHCDICDVPMGHTRGLPIPVAMGTGFMQVWVRVGPELPMGYPCYALAKVQS